MITAAWHCQDFSPWFTLASAFKSWIRAHQDHFKLQPRPLQPALLPTTPKASKIRKRSLSFHNKSGTSVLQPGLASLPSPAALLQDLPFAILSNCIKTDKVQRDKWWTPSITFRFPSGRKPFIQTCLERAPERAGGRRGAPGPGLTRPSTSTKSDRRRPLPLPCRANGANGRRKVWRTLAYPPKYAGQ